ncbi:CheY chemotaxis protein or a CheY-like REC (receiver) domain [Polaribacter sp. KT25b]|uniref:response regulator n=1 Tax=Polaribacter sp. KT25b TaxID=1855336 RepID=UPI00087AAD6C|nr:response regulator [Polaribacter sp. KT25b]SDR90347.1 CheY chemotaxis protein or a CheY-like REC (receiver) domain [Polaribacter sp. KT25b]
MIKSTIKILLIEDNAADAVLIERQIKKIVTSPQIKCIDLYNDFITTLKNFKPDIILCDYRLKGYSGSDVLEYMNTNLSFYIPLVFVTGAIKDEELAANSILSGASGYILKNNMNSLHEKLLPHFKKIESLKNNHLIDQDLKLKIEQLQNYINGVKNDNTINIESFNEMKKAFDKLKYLIN